MWDPSRRKLLCKLYSHSLIHTAFIYCGINESKSTIFTLRYFTPFQELHKVRESGPHRACRGRYFPCLAQRFTCCVEDLLIFCWMLLILQTNDLSFLLRFWWFEHSYRVLVKLSLTRTSLRLALRLKCILVQAWTQLSSSVSVQEQEDHQCSVARSKLQETH